MKSIATVHFGEDYAKIVAVDDGQEYQEFEVPRSLGNALNVVAKNSKLALNRAKQMVEAGSGDNATIAALIQEAIDRLTVQYDGEEF